MPIKALLRRVMGLNRYSLDTSGKPVYQAEWPLPNIAAVPIIKASLEYVGLYGGPLRPPFRAMNTGEKAELHAITEEIGVMKAAGVAG